MKRTVKYIRKFGIAIAGILLLIVGAALLVLPGPGLLVILAGLIVLSFEFEWAEKYVHQVRQKMHEASDKVRGGKQPTKNKPSSSGNRPTKKP